MAQCYAPGGASEKRNQWTDHQTNENGTYSTPHQQSYQAFETQEKEIMQEIIGLANHQGNEMAMSVNVTKAKEIHTWHVDSAASRHMTGNLALFQSTRRIPLVFIEIANRKSFVADQEGTIHMQIISDATHNLPKLPIQLTNIIFVPGLDKSLLSVGRMMNAGVNI